MIDALRDAPLDPRFHRRLGDLYAQHGRWQQAVAAYRTSLALGATEPSVRLALAKAYLALGHAALALPIVEDLDAGADARVARAARALRRRAGAGVARPVSTLAHGRYARLRLLADRIGQLGAPALRLLDVGGGDGELALLLPGAAYVLVEPEINGLSGTSLPFPDRSFDVVVASHVLEHIDEADRRRFLTELCAKAGRLVLLLNPFRDADPHATPRLELVLALTRARWAREHLGCGLPSLAEVEAFARDGGIPYRIAPHGSVATTFAMTLVEHYARLAGRAGDLDRINEFTNTRYLEAAGTSATPTDHIVELDVSRGGR